MPNYVIKNGEILEADQVSTSYFGRSNKYGDGFFETIYLFNGNILYWHLHYQRLSKTAKLLQYDLPAAWDSPFFEQQIVKLASANNIITGRVTIHFNRDVEGYYLPTGSGFHYLIQIVPQQNEGLPYQLNEEGLVLGEYRELIKTSNYTSTLKTSNALIYVLAAIDAKKHKWDESLIFNEYGRVAECVSSNIVLCFDDKLVAPSFGEYGIDGVMRHVLFQKAEAYGYRTELYPIYPEDLFSAQEVWLTNVMKGITWVKEYKGKQYSNDKASQLLGLLNK